MSSSPASLWRHQDFLKLWVGETVSVFGSQISALAIPLTAVLILQATPFEMGILTAVEFAPFLFISLFAGVWVDRLRRRPILITADIGRAVFLGAIPVAALGGVLNMPFLYVTALGVGVLTVFFDIAYQAYLPALVDRDQLVEGNSKLEATNSLAQIAGPAMAGGLVQLLTAPFAVALDAVSFLFSAACLLFVRKPEPVPSRQHEDAQNIWREIGQGLHVVFDSPILRSIAGCTGTSNFFSSMRGAVFTIFVIRELHLSPAMLGLVFGVGSVGALAGAVATNAIARRFGIGRTIIGSTLLGAIGALAIPLASTAWALPFVMLTIGQMVGSFANPVYNITQVSLRQAITPQTLQGRMNASMRFLVWGTIPLGSLAGGALAEVIGVVPTIVLSVVGGMLAVFWVYFSPVRTLRQVEPVVDIQVGPTAEVA
jgi:MFS family permease